MQIGTETFTSDGIISLSLTLTNNNAIFQSVDNHKTFLNRVHGLGLSAVLSVDGPNAESEIDDLRTWYLANGSTEFSFIDGFPNTWTGTGLITTNRIDSGAYHITLVMDVHYSASGAMPDVSYFGGMPILEAMDVTQIKGVAQDGDHKTAIFSDVYENYTVDLPLLYNAEFIAALGYFRANFNDDVSIVTYKGTIAGKLSSSSVTFSTSTNLNKWSCGSIFIERGTLT